MFGDEGGDEKTDLGKKEKKTVIENHAEDHREKAKEGLPLTRNGPAGRNEEKN